MAKDKSRRILETLPGILSWLILISPFFLINVVPTAIATFYVLFCLFWLFRSLSYAYHLLESYRNYRHLISLSWKNAVPDASQAIVQKLLQKYSMRMKSSRKQKTLQAKEIHHMVVVAMYNEPYEVLADTFQALSHCSFDKKRLHIVLASEERKKEHAMVVAEHIKQNFGNSFGSFTHVMHPKDLPGEIPGKGANISFAAKEAVKQLGSGKKAAFPSLEHVVVTSLDSDNKPHKHYFSVLSTFYALAENRAQYSYQPLPFVYNNVWSVPIFNRLVAISSTFWHFIESGRNDRLRNFSSHAQPLSALMEMDFWSKNTIVEDGHQFWRSYLHFKGQYKVLPIFIPIYQDAVENSSYYTSLLGQYKQLRRWAFGAEDIAFIIEQYWKHKKELPFFISMYHILSLIEGHLMWSTAAILLTISSSLFPLLNPTFTETSVFFNLSYILSLLFTISFVGIVISIWISFLTLPPIPKAINGWRRLFLFFSIFFQWLLLPIVTICFASLPALEAQTRLIIGNKLGFEVTKKVRS